MDRLTSGGFTEVLDRLAPAIGRGSVNVMSVAAIRDRSPKTWARRREQVEAFVERAYHRISGDEGIIVALNDIEFLAVHTERSRLAALNLSASILKETLTFFVGTAARHDMRIMQVTDFRDGELSVQTVNPDHLLQTPAPEWERSGGSAAEADQAWDRIDGTGELSPPDRRSRRGRDDDAPRWRPMDGRTGRAVRLTTAEHKLVAHHSLRFTWNAKNNVVTSFLIETRTEPQLTEAMSPLLASEAARATLAFAAHQVQSCCDSGTPVGMHVPVPIAALSNTAARYPVLQLLRELPLAVRRLLIVELTELPEGVPPSRLTEAVSMVSPHVRAVLARAPSETTNVLNWARCGLRGVTLDCDRIQVADSLALGAINIFARNALALAPACVGYSLHTKSLMIAAWSAGFTHLSGDALGREIPSVAAFRLLPLELYRRTMAKAAAAA